MPRTLWTTVNVVMLLAFAFSVVVQVNDPDPFAWIAVYGIAAIACLLALLRRDHWALPAAGAAVALVWAATIAPRVVGRVRFLDMFGAFEMENVGVEESREMYGLLLIALWLAVLAIAAYRRAHQARRSPTSNVRPAAGK